jgi:hypothetical protein
VTHCLSNWTFYTQNHNLHTVISPRVMNRWNYIWLKLSKKILQENKPARMWRKFLTKVILASKLDSSCLYRFWYKNVTEDVIQPSVKCIKQHLLWPFFASVTFPLVMVPTQHSLYFYLMTKKYTPSETPCFVDQETIENALIKSQLCKLLKVGGGISIFPTWRRRKEGKVICDPWFLTSGFWLFT